MLHWLAAGICCEGRPATVVLPYRRFMPARKRPTPEDTVTARQTLLDGLARDRDIFELMSELLPLHPRDNTFPGEVFLPSPRTRWTGAGPAGRTRCPWRDYASGSCPRALPRQAK